MLVSPVTLFFLFVQWVLFGAVVGGLVGVVARFLGGRWRHVAYSAVFGVIGCIGGAMLKAKFDPWSTDPATGILAELRPLFPEDLFGAALVGALCLSIAACIGARLLATASRGARA